MYFPIGWVRNLSIHQTSKYNLMCITTNRYNMLFAVVTQATISIWHCKPCVEITCYQRSIASLNESGSNVQAEWRQDSSMLAVSTDKGHLLIYQLEQDVAGERGLILYKYHQASAHQGDSSDSIPALRLSLIMNMSCGATITCLSAMHDKLLIAQDNGKLKLLLWETPLNRVEDLSVSDIPFSVDMHLAGTMLQKKSIFVKDAVFSPFLDGLSVVLNDGRAARIVFNDLVDSSQDLAASNPRNAWSAKGLWAPGINDATCTTVNNKYRLLCFGNSKGECCIYMIDDIRGSLLLSHTIALSPTNYPTLHKYVGSVLKINWSSDGCALALSWNKGGLSIWSVFGACLYCTIPSDQPISTNKHRLCSEVFTSMCWGVEGYNLWLLSDESCEDRDSLTDETCDKSTSLLILPFLKSSLTINPCMSNHSHILLQSEDRIYLSIGERSQVISISTTDGSRHISMIPRSSTYSSSLSNSSSAYHISTRSSSLHDLNPQLDFTSAVSSYDIPNGDTSTTKTDNSTDMSSVGNKQWIVIPYPSSYLPNNWPIRFCTIDNTGSYLAIAGNFGLAHYSLATRKWKVFGNVIQEKEMVVTGGMTWWKEFLVVACFTLSSNQEEVRVYPRQANLENSFACIQKVSSQVLLINVFQNKVILFTYGSHIQIFAINETSSQRQVPTVQLNHLQDIDLRCYVLYPTLVVSVTMTSLHMETSAARRHMSSNMTNAQRDTPVILVNVAGRLLLFQQSLSEDSLGDQKKFSTPIVLASCVENIWTTEDKKSEKIHLTDALWIGCGSMGIRVWLPLFPPSQPPTRTSGQSINSSNKQNHNRTSSSGLEMQMLTSRRITLTFSLDTCYPLSVMYDKAVILGVTSERWQYQNIVNEVNTTHSQSPSCLIHYSSIDHNCEIFLQQILCQLLRRNLGYHALQLATTCRALSCFPHVLELMLHEVLEEEATASEPIPDPLLPTVIKFIAEFPEYHMTVVHCARKTEIALWKYLFNYVGSPKELFEECLQSDQLKTAASYLIILQNLEHLPEARQDATRLFDRALYKEEWILADEIVRFLRAIGDGDGTTEPRQPTLMNTNIYPAVSPTTAYISQTSVDTETSFKFSVKSKNGSEAKQVSTSGGGGTLPRTDSFTITSSPVSQPYVTQHSVRKYHQDQPHHRTLVPSSSNPISDSTPRRVSCPENIQKQKLPSECAEHYFIEILLARQARKMLSQGRVCSLGKFASHVNFQLVPWLKKEQNRAARIEDAVLCLKALHHDFDWPYPAANPSNTNSINSINANFSKALDLTFKQTSQNNNTLFESPKKTLMGSHESVVALPARRGSRTSAAYELQTEASETSETSLGFDQTSLDMQLSYTGKTSSDTLKGSSRSGLQLRYLLELFLQSFCLEWALLICLLLNEPLSLERLVRSARATSDNFDFDVKLIILQRLRRNLVNITNWAEADCFGYLAVLNNLDEGLQHLRDVINESEVIHAEKQAILAYKKMNDHDSKLVTVKRFHSVPDDVTSSEKAVEEDTHSQTCDEEDIEKKSSEVCEISNSHSVEGSASTCLEEEEKISLKEDSENQSEAEDLVETDLSSEDENDDLFCLLM